MMEFELGKKYWGDPTETLESQKCRRIFNNIQILLLKADLYLSGFIYSFSIIKTIIELQILEYDVRVRILQQE